MTDAAILVKACMKCRQIKSITEFSKDAKAKKDGLRTGCKACMKISRAAHYAANFEEEIAAAKSWREENADKVKAQSAAYYKANTALLNAKNAVYRANNGEKISAYRAANSGRAAAYRADNADKLADYHRKYYAANRERLMSASALRLEQNREQINQRERERYDKAEQWRTKNPERYRKKRDEYVAANAETRKIYALNRRARKLQSGGRLSPGLADRLLSLQRGLCPCCRQPLGTDFHMDHIIPLALGGANDDSNMQLLRAVCNLTKNAKHPIDFMQSRGFLL